MPFTLTQKLTFVLLFAAFVGLCWRDSLVSLAEGLRSLDLNQLGALAAYDDGRYVFLFVMFVGLMFFATVLGTYRMKIDGAIKKQKSNPSYLRKFQQLSQQELNVPVLRPNAWRGLSESLDCMIVKVPDRRRAVWKLEDTDEKNLTLSASLLYTPEPIGRKRSQIYPRLLHLNARVEGFGVSSKLYLTYSVDSPMDLVAVKELIRKTNESIVSHMMAAETDPARLSEFVDSINLTASADSNDHVQALGYKFSNQAMNF
jgi:hypothetical protein